MEKIKLAESFQLSFTDYPIKDEWCSLIYTIGCPHNCPGCHNGILQNRNYDYDYEFTIDELLYEMELVAKYNLTNNFAIIGGEPLAPWNINAIKELLIKNKKFNIILYTGYELKYVLANNVKGFKYLKTGLYDETCLNDQSNIDSEFVLASKNQKIYDSNLNLLSKDGVFNK